MKPPLAHGVMRNAGRTAAEEVRVYVSYQQLELHVGRSDRCDWNLFVNGDNGG